jgi:hypothetical protein
MDVQPSPPPVRIARELIRTANSAWGSSLETWVRSREIAEESRQALQRSDALLEWWDTFGPRQQVSALAPLDLIEIAPQKAREPALPGA